MQESSLKENRKYYSNSIFSKILNKIGINTSKITKEQSLVYAETFLKIEDNSYIEGYFQSGKYFKWIRKELIDQFSIKKYFSNYTKEIKNKISKSPNSCSIHARRGDFINNTNALIHGTCSMEYYNNAVNDMQDKIGSLSYFIFSDDINWCKENLQIENALY